MTTTHMTLDLIAASERGEHDARQGSRNCPYTERALARAWREGFALERMELQRTAVRYHSALMTRGL